MRRFVFRLETVLRHRETVEELCQQLFAQAQSNYQQQQSRLRAIHEEFARVVAERPGNIGEPFDAHLIFDRERYLETLQAAITEQKQRVASTRTVLDERREALLTARQARESVSQLRDKDLALHRESALKAEQEILDELATMRHVRKAA